MTQMKGGLKSHSLAGLPLPRNFGHQWGVGGGKKTKYTGKEKYKEKGEINFKLLRLFINR